MSVKVGPVVESIEQLIGGTPLLRLRRSLEALPVGRWGASQGLKAPLRIQSELLAKIEFQNPGGSVKDRIALSIIESAEKSGKLKPGGTIVEATSGNTGAGLAVLAAARGYKAIFVMPDKMSAEKINALRAYGAKVVVTPTAAEPTSPDYYCNVAKRIAETTPNGFLADQYFNPDNPRAHFETTGPEVWQQTGGRIDAFICGIGTGGTLSGTAKYLKQKNPDIRIVAIDPHGSIYASVIETGKAGPAGPYLVEGVGEDMIPGTMDVKMVNTVVTVHDDESFGATRLLAQTEGLLVGGSCGGAFFGAVQYLAREEARTGKPLRAVVLLPDSGSRYLSKIFNDGWMKEKSLDPSWGNKSGGAVEFLPSAKKIQGV